ncbi:MAG: cob(I)yrinic acid a,c-diamide adenosyltransferase, partial [Dehalococcoidia bacterium]|nr:cob(I)yrinic acid a,c-diamide adenosyltransferase [Dehalococcoidia bacterium]
MEELRDAPGQVIVFTGNGKGKTSAALGVAIRALGHGLRVYFTFFMKGDFPYGEQQSLAHLSNMSLGRFGFVEFCDPNNVKPEEKEEAQRALQAAQQAMHSSSYDVVVLDEVNVAASWGLVTVNQVVETIRSKPEAVDLILTGRYADEKVLALADTVTEM